MKAIVFVKKGKEKLVLRDIEMPVLKENEVLIRVRAVSVNAADYRMMKMGFAPKSLVFGADVAGIVEAVGSEVKAVHPGDEVVGDLSDFGYGGFAEYCSAPEEILVSKPGNLSFEEAASFPLAGVTALQAVRNLGNVRPGDKVLIVGASGGVGSFAVQLARFFGADVTAVCSSGHAERAKEIGAGRVIDYKTEELIGDGDFYHLILGVNGNYPLLTYRRGLLRRGKFVMVGGSYWQVIKTLLFSRLLSLGTRNMTHLYAKSNVEDLRFLLGLADKGKLKAVIQSVIAIEEAPPVIWKMTEGHSSGKVILSFGSGE